MPRDIEQTNSASLKLQLHALAVEHDHVWSLRYPKPSARACHNTLVFPSSIRTHSCHAEARELVDLQPLSGLMNLSELVLTGCRRVTDLTPVMHLVSLGGLKRP